MQISFLPQSAMCFSGYDLSVSLVVKCVLACLICSPSMQDTNMVTQTFVADPIRRWIVAYSPRLSG